MLTKGIIVGRVVGTNKYAVRLPYFESAGDDVHAIREATLAYTPGVIDSLVDGDVVIVGFEDHFASKPIIVGKLFVDDDLRRDKGALNIERLDVTGNASLPLNTTIGGIQISELTHSGGGSSEIESISVNDVAVPIVSGNANISVPTKTSDLTNDSDFATHTDLDNYVDLTSDQQISGNKTLLNKAIKFADASGNGMSIAADNASRLKITNNNNAVVLYLQTNGMFSPNNMTLGSANNKFNNLYLGGSLINGAYSITVPNIASKADLASYVDLANEQTITGLKNFNIRPQVASSPIGTGKNLFSTRWSYGQWTSTGGSGSSYLYFKLPDDTKTYTLSIGTKDTTVDFGSGGNVFGLTGNGGSASAGYQWLANGNQLSTSVRVITPSDMRYISLYTKSEQTFEKLIARYNIQLEEGDVATAYEPWVDPEAEEIYYDVALKPEIPTKTSELTNDSGFVTVDEVNVYPYASNSTTTLQYETINNVSISADATYTLATAPANTYPEYKANITNTDISNAITITLPSGTKTLNILTNTIGTNTISIGAGETIELTIQNDKAKYINWGA